mmetsp:Transcript_41784/g.95873  ORF Transcript_41784/g.95873 Transcript_41784/m.95873 type:complete len:714 (+) Transcript_41784:99-2240(+)
MKSIAIVGLLLLGAVLPGSALKRAHTDTSSPVERVVKLLSALKERIKTTEKEELQMYDKYACWCEKTTARKAKAIEDAEELLHVTGQSILEYKAKVATLMREIQQLTEEIEANLEAQKEATALRQKQNAAYMAESTETKQALAALEQAIAVLVKATGGGGDFLQTQKSELQSLFAALPAKAFASVSPEKASLLQTFATSKAAYAPQSITVQGMLADMYSTFAADLEKATRDESKQNANYEAFIAAKQEELENLQSMKEKKEKDKAEAEATLAQLTELYDDTEKQMKADIEFFDATKAACRDKHAEWTERQVMRKQELEGIDKALEILTTDEARELFGHTIQAGLNTGTFFIQLSRSSQPAQAAYDALKASAAKAHSLRLARLAVTVGTAKVGHFDKVLKAIDEMIQVLKEEETSDIKKKDQCIEEYKNTNSTISDLSWKISVNQAKIEKYEATIAQLKKDLVETEEAIVQTLKDIDEMLKQRTEENQAYLADKEDDMKAVGLLEQAKGYFSDYYKEHGYMSLAQKQPVFNAEPAFNISADEAPEVVFSHAGHRKDEASGIVKLFDVVLSDLREEMATSMKLEAEAQVAYEKANATATELLNSLEAKKVNLEESIAATNQLKAEETTLMENNEASLKDEEAYLASITPDCDWMIGSFDERDAKREAEMKGLTEAKTFLSQYYEKAQAAAQEEALTQVSSNLLASARPISPHRLH